MTLREKYPKGFKSEAEANAALRGKEFKITEDGTGARSGHGFVTDTPVKILSIVYATRKDWYVTASALGLNRTVYAYELKAPMETVEDINDAISKIDEEIASMSGKKELLVNSINFMKEHNLEKYDERLFKALNVLTKLGKKATDVERAQALAKYIS